MDHVSLEEWQVNLRAGATEIPLYDSLEGWHVMWMQQRRPDVRAGDQDSPVRRCKALSNSAARCLVALLYPSAFAYRPNPGLGTSV